MAGPYVGGTSAGFPQTGANRTRLQATQELAQYVGGETRGDALIRCGQVWDGAVREANSVAWKFNRVTQDILLDSSMPDNTTAPTVSRDTGTGTGFVLASDKSIVYWVEERVKSGSTITKRNFAPSGTTVSLAGDGTTDKPVITRPATVGTDTTHWALFGTAAGGTYPNGAEIAEVVIVTTTIEDTRLGNNPALPTGALYEPSNFSLNTTFRNPRRAFIVDTDGFERHQVEYVPYEESHSPFETNQPSSSFPSFYTVKNAHLDGEVILFPRVRLPGNWPIFRLVYHKWIALASGDGDKLNVPVAVDEMIFKLAVAGILSRVRSFEEARTAFAVASDFRSWVEQEFRDYPDF